MDIEISGDFPVAYPEKWKSGGPLKKLFFENPVYLAFYKPPKTKMKDGVEVVVKQYESQIWAVGAIQTHLEWDGVDGYSTNPNKFGAYCRGWGDTEFLIFEKSSE